MTEPDDHRKNRRGFVIVLIVAIAALALFLLLFLSAPASERHSPLATGKAPVSSIPPTRR